MKQRKVLVGIAIAIFIILLGNYIQSYSLTLVKI